MLGLKGAYALLLSLGICLCVCVCGCLWLCVKQICHCCHAVMDPFFLFFVFGYVIIQLLLLDCHSFAAYHELNIFSCQSIFESSMSNCQYIYKILVSQYFMTFNSFPFMYIFCNRNLPSRKFTFLLALNNCSFSYLLLHLFLF